MHIGLIGGIGPAATDFYYRRIIARFAAQDRSLELTIVHADTPTLLRRLAAKDYRAQVATYVALTGRLAKAGAECVAVTSIAGHFCIGAFTPVSPLPVINMISEIERVLTLRRVAKIGVFGTRTVMATKLYGRLPTIEVLPPLGDDFDAVHDAYVAMAASGVVTDAQLEVFIAAGRRLRDEAEVEAILLGGTDLSVIGPKLERAFPIIDGAAIHADAISARAGVAA